MWRNLSTLVACLFALAVVIAVVPSCGSDDDDDEDYDWGGSDDDVQDFLDAIPDYDGLALTLPELDTQAKAGLGELANYYDYTVDFTRDVNEHVLMFLSWIDEITSYPPSGEIDGGYEWGPWVGSGLSPVEARFWMKHTGEGVYDYGLQWRPRDTDDEWSDVWLGSTTASTDTARRGIGDFSVDFTTAQALDPTIDLSGDVNVDYDTVTDGREIAVEYIQFYNDEDDDMAGPVDGEYFYHSHADLTGSFLFDWYHDIHYEQYHGEQYADFEHAWFNTRWQGDGAGRADVVVTDGDIPDFEFEDVPLEQFLVSECWGTDFLRLYYVETAHLENGDDLTGEEQGDASSCVFDQEMPAAE